jgi:DNA processing protein
MPETRQAALLALCRIKGLNWNLIAREACRPDGLDRLLRGEVFEDSKSAKAAGPLLAEALPELDRLREDVDRTIEGARADGIRLTTVLDDNYPLNLRTIFNAPPFLFYRGELRAAEDARSVAVVGTRRASQEGLRRAEKMARLLVAEGVTVLSGLARGIDTAAHAAALKAKGRTVAVVGTGIRRVYPKENKELAERIAQAGAVVSQFWPDAAPATYTFPRRNVTMSGMGQGTVVIEASSTSGAKMQARLALEHGKKAFLVSRLVTEQPWARTYLERGAIEVREVEEIVACLRSEDEIRRRSRRAHQLGLRL